MSIFLVRIVYNIRSTNNWRSVDTTSTLHYRTGLKGPTLKFVLSSTKQRSVKLRRFFSSKTYLWPTCNLSYFQIKINVKEKVNSFLGTRISLWNVRSITVNLVCFMLADNLAEEYYIG